MFPDLCRHHPLQKAIHAGCAALSMDSFRGGHAKLVKRDPIPPTSSVLLAAPVMHSPRSTSQAHTPLSHMTPVPPSPSAGSTDDQQSDSGSSCTPLLPSQTSTIRTNSTMRLSVRLNPSDEDECVDMESKQQPLQIAKVPKKRGRKPILPKMTNSERGKYYRAKRQAYSSVLAQDVEALRSSVSRLIALRNISSELAVCPRNLISGSLVKLVREYFAQFRHGVQLPPARRKMTLPDVEISTASQEIFMNAVMDPDVCFGEFKGIGVVMDQWTRYSKYHAYLQFELLEARVLHNEGGHIVETSGLLRTRYSRTTIENVFPHVVGNEALIQRLIGKEIVYPCRNQFYFTPEGRVQRYDVEADFPEALQAAIGNLEDVAILLGQALIRQQHMMGELEGEELAVIEAIERRDSPFEDDDAMVDGNTSVSRVMDVDFLLSDSSTSEDAYSSG